ncbi:MAG: DUF4271 domain-containing protein [Marinilabiliaceae bacterium]|nr:DUF4271 domain-containing protein [Marinilabiliaceae bacterium]
MTTPQQITSDSTQTGNTLLKTPLKVDFNPNQTIQVPKPLYQPVILKDTLLPKVLVTRVPKDPIVKLSYDDSVALNLIPIYSDSTHYFFDNTLIRYLSKEKGKNQVNKSQNDKAFLTGELLTKDTLFIPQRKPVTVAVQKKMIEKPISQSVFYDYYSWLIPVIIIIIYFAGLIRLSSGKYISQLFSAIIYSHVATTLYKSINLKNSLPSLGLNFLFQLTFGVFVFELIIHFRYSPFDLYGFWIFAFSIAITVLLLIIKTGAYYFLGYIFNIKQQTDEFLFHANLVNKVLGLILLPFILVLPFLSENGTTTVIQGGIIVFVTCYFIQIFRGVRIFLSEHFSVVYLFLYLCALEILPLAILYKLIML